MESILSTIKYKFELISNAITTGNFKPLKEEIKTHLQQHKNMYTVLTFLVILYVLYEDELYASSCHVKHKKQIGGQTPPANAPKTPAAANAPKTPDAVANEAAGQSANTKGKKGKKGKEGNNDSGSGSSGSMGMGLCDGSNIFAKGCGVVKDGMMGYIKIIGYLILAGLIVLSPFVIYIILVYMVLKIMFKGVKAI